MMVIVLRHKIQMIHQPHRQLQTRMQQCHAPNVRPIDSPLDSPLAFARLGNPPISAPAVAHCGSPRSLRFLKSATVSSPPPATKSSTRAIHKGSRSNKMSGMLLRRPLPLRFPAPDPLRTTTQNLFQPRRRAPQSRHHIRMEFHRKRKIKLPLKPRQTRLIHPSSPNSRKTQMRQSPPAQRIPATQTPRANI